MGGQIVTQCHQVDETYAGPPSADWNSWQEQRFIELSKLLEAHGALAQEIINEFLESLNSAKPPAGVVKEFATKFLKDLVDPLNCAHLPAQLRTTQLAMLLAGLEKSGGANAVYDAWSGLSTEDHARLVELASSEGLRFADKRIRGLEVRDPMLVITESVAKFGSSEQALALIRAVDQQSQGRSFDNKYFSYRDHKPFAERAQALSEVFLAHHDDILKALTVRDIRVVEGQTNAKKTVSGDNLAVLANLVRITALNPNNPKSAAVREVLSKFTFEQIRTGNLGPWEKKIADKPDRETEEFNRKVDVHNREVTEAIERVSKITGAMRYALEAGYEDVHADEAEQLAFRQAIAEFAIDTVLKYLPAGKFVGEELGRELADALPTNSLFREPLRKAIDEVSKELATRGGAAATGKFKEMVRERLIQNLPAEYRDLEKMKGMFNIFVQAITDTASFHLDDLTEKASIERARG
jgi:hypothetical protein